MDIKETLNQVIAGILALDARKKTALASAFVITLAGIIFISFQASKPATIPLYSNLTREDMSNMSRILSENGIKFVVATDQNTIQVPPSVSGRARMLLAEHGLPAAESTGYQLFDQVNTLGLTSFMQNITNKRAIEGELVRTIQMISGVNSARVHLVIEERNVFRQSGTSNSSASVVLRTTGKLPSRSIKAIRHMVAAAVPGLSSDNVTIVGADGTLLTTKDDASATSLKLVEMEREYAKEMEEKIQLALGAYIGVQNLRVSASVKLNSDKRRIEEVIFDPESRIERSVQIIREAGKTENKETATPVTIEQNLPEEEVAGGNGQLSSENSERREELTNYEINERKVSLVSDGYQVERQTVAVLINRARIFELLGGNPAQADIDGKITELNQIVSSAISLTEDRGDQVTVSIVDFMPEAAPDAIESGSFLGDVMTLHLGSILNAFGMIAAALAISLLGIRPLLAFLGRETNAAPNIGSLEAPLETPALGELGGPDMEPLGEQLDELGEVPSLEVSNLGSADMELADLGVPEMEMAELSMSPDLEMSAPEEMPGTMSEEAKLRTQLQKMVEQSEEKTVNAIRHWLQQDRATV